MKLTKFLLAIACVALLFTACNKDSKSKRIAGTPKTINDIDCVYIPAGTFLMGSPEDEPDRESGELQHSVTLTKGFYMGKYEITNAQFCEFLNDIKSSLDYKDMVGYNDFYKELPVVGKVRIVSAYKTEESLQYNSSFGSFYVISGYENRPIRGVTWYGANEYANWKGGTLPTEAQWEYACRAGKKESLPFGIGDGKKLKKGMASFNSKYEYDLAEKGEYYNEKGYIVGPVDVSSFSPNAWGLYNMHGNVPEWCSDKFDNYQSAAQTDPLGPESGKYYVLRGGDYQSNANNCRSAYRQTADANFTVRSGFRVVFAE